MEDTAERVGQRRSRSVITLMALTAIPNLTCCRPLVPRIACGRGRTACRARSRPTAHAKESRRACSVGRWSAAPALARTVASVTQPAGGEMELKPMNRRVIALDDHQANI